MINSPFLTPEMKIVVKAAHFIKKTCFLRDMVEGTLHSLGLSAASLMRQATDALSDTRGCVYKIRGEVFVHNNIFDDLYAQCNEDDRKALRISLADARVVRDYRFQVVLSVEPFMKVGALKSLLKATSWIPEKKLVLVKDEESSLDDDSSTLIDCGIEEYSELLACMGGSYPLTLNHRDHPDPNKEFVIPISSCFETVGELKKKIHQKTGKTPNDQVIFYQGEVLRNSDNSPLVCCGIVRQYLKYMPKMSKGVQMVTWDDDEKKLIESVYSTLPRGLN